MWRRAPPSAADSMTPSTGLLVGSLNDDAQGSGSEIVYQRFNELPDSTDSRDSLRQRLREYVRQHSCGSSVNVSFSANGGGSTSNEDLQDEIRNDPEALRDYMRFKLQFHFMNPIEKWQVGGRFPWKWALQILKLVVVTVQVVVFGTDSGTFQQQHRNTHMALEHILLQNWDTSRDVLIYPPPAGPYGIHTKAEFYDHVNHVVSQYSNITSAPIGSFGYCSKDGKIVPVVFCQTIYKQGSVWPFNSTLEFDSNRTTECTDLDTTWPANDKAWLNFSLKHFLEKEISFERLIDAKLSFPLKALYRTKRGQVEVPECYQYNVTVFYENVKHDGQMDIKMTITPSLLHCHTTVKRSYINFAIYYSRQALNIITIVICVLSTLLCARSLYRAQKLRHKTGIFFLKQFGKQLSRAEKLQFFDFWLLVIIVDDILLEAGSVVKIQIEEHLLPGLMYNACALLLGCGTLFAWCGLLRYVGYFKTYNILILTLKMSVPNVLRFLLCAVLLFCGYAVCGWVVIGPHHIKFRTLSTSAECLFSIINGDDIFATYAMLFKRNSVIVWYFAQAFMYSFVILFIYLVVSLFVAIIVDAYETIRDTQRGEDTVSVIRAFIAESVDDPTSGIYRSDDAFEKRGNPFS